MTESARVFVRGLGFRPRRGLRLADPISVAKDADHGVRVMSVLSTEMGTEIAFEFRDSELEAQCFAAPSDQRWTSGSVRLRERSGALLQELPPGRGQRVSVGSHEFGFLRRELAFEPMHDGVRSIELELRGQLGEWNVPLDLVPIGQTDVAPATPIDAKQERKGVSVRLGAVALTDDAMYLEVDATATSPQGSVVGIGAWMSGSADHRFVVLDEEGRRFEEVVPTMGRRMRQDPGRAIAAFVRPLEDSARLTLVVPRVVVKELAASLELPLPVFAPTDLALGPYPVTIRWADVVDDVRTAPGETTTRGVQVRFKSGEWRNGRRVLWPGSLLVDGAGTWNYGFDHADPQGLSINIRLRDGDSAKTVTLLEPLVEVLGPWEIQWRG
jgi:hypothetical protein